MTAALNHDKVRRNLWRLMWCSPARVFSGGLLLAVGCLRKGTVGRHDCSPYPWTLQSVLENHTIFWGVHQVSFTDCFIYITDFEGSMLVFAFLALCCATWKHRVLPTTSDCWLRVCTTVESNYISGKFSMHTSYCVPAFNKAVLLHFS